MDSQALQLTRTASLGSFDFELCVTPTAKDKAGNLTKSASCHADLDVTFKLLGKSPCKRKLEPILDEDAPAELPEESVLPEDDSRVEVAKLLGGARRVSLERLLGVCGDKLATLQGRIR